MIGSSKDHPIERLTVSAADNADDEHLRTALAEIAGQDPTLTIDAEQRGILHTLEGSGTSHLGSICDCLRGEYHVAINVGPLEAVLLETIRKPAEAEGKYIRQIGGHGNYGHCWLHIEPSKPHEGYAFTSTVSADALPHDYLSSIDRGVQQTMHSGVLSGQHLVDLKVTVVDGSYHETDSNNFAFQIAGAIALKNAVQKAVPVILEPMMSVEIEVPQGLAAAIRNEIYTHRGRVESDLAADGLSEIQAIVPLAELLLSNSSTLAEFPTELTGYEPVSRGGRSTDEGAGVTANKPNHPRQGRGSESAWPDPPSQAE